MKRLVSLVSLIIFLSVLGLCWSSTSTTLAQDFPDVCQQAENIMPNCNFDNGLSGWVPYLETGAANISVLQGGGECHAPLCPAAYIVTESHFIGGIYQQAPVAAGNTYYANIVWLAFDSFVNDPSINSVVGGIGRRIGIDPFGGVDPKSENIIWSEDNWRNDCKICNVEQAIATAQADTITVFIRIDDTWRPRAAEKGYTIPPSKDQFWLDDIGLKQIDGSAAPQAASTEPPPTDTAAPPTDTPVSLAPTNTPAPELPADLPAPAEVAQAESPEVEEAVSPLATPAPINTIAPPPTLTPSPTRTPTPSMSGLARVVSTPTPRAPAETLPAEEPAILSAGMLSVVGTTACVGGLILLIMGAIIAGLVWLYRLGWGQTDTDEADYDFDDNVEEIVIDIDE